MSELRNIGSPIPRNYLGALRPKHVLDELDRPTLFTASFPTTQLALVYWIEEDALGDDVRLVVPTQSTIIEHLLRGELTIREALRQPWAWLAFGDGDARSIRVEDLPHDCLPRAGIYLSREFEPIISVRFTGDIDENNVTASIIGRATDTVRRALKPLLDYVTDRDVEGRPTNSLRRLYDLPARRMAYGSFEVDFGAPAQLDLLGDDRRYMEQAAGMLRRGLSWAAETSKDSTPPDDPEWDAILTALRYLVPPGTGQVSNVELSGQLTGSKVSLNRQATRNVIRALKFRGKPKAVNLEGYVREFDRDKLTFTLRPEPGVMHGEKCYCDESLVGDVDDAFNSERRVNLIGFRSGGWIQVVVVEELAEHSGPDSQVEG
ncbi:MAG: hypothetical protein JWP01_3392 [Myxococcales bacterium]|nr:hypothetical protein [Myxococcales bacterium]